MFKNRSKKILLATSIFSMLLLGACQSNTTAINETATTSSNEENIQKATDVTKEETIDTRIIQMEYGDVEIPASPKRVVVAFFQGDLLALGIKPVGTSFK